MTTSVDEVADGIYRISTAVTMPDGPVLLHVGTRAGGEHRQAESRPG